MAQKWSRIGKAFLTALFTVSVAASGYAQSGTAATPATSADARGTSTTSGPAAPAPRPATRKHRRTHTAQQSSPSATPQTLPPTQVGPTAAQRARDARLLASQKAQSARMAKENDQVTQSVVRERQQQQAEPRIQDAPGPGSEPLPGDPAIAPVEPAKPPRIQDAPGPAQTLPQAPPPAPQP